MIYINTYLAILVKNLNKDNLIFIYCYIVTVLLLILSLHLFYLEPVELQFSHCYLDTGMYKLNLCINNFDHLSLPEDNLYIRFVRHLTESDRVHTVPRDNFLRINNNYGDFHTNKITNNNKGPSAVLNLLDIRLKLEQECKLRLERDYQLKFEDYRLSLVKYIEEGLKEI